MFAPYDRTTDRILARYLASSRADVVVSVWPVLHHFLAALAPPSIATVAHEHLLYAYHPPAIRPALRAAYAKLDGIVSVAAAAASEFREQFPELAEKIHYIPNAVPSPRVPPSVGDANLVVTAGRLDPMKRFDLLIEAFARVVCRHPDWRLRIYGEGKDRARLAALIEERGLHSTIFLMGMVSPMEAEWVKGSIGVLTSEAESFGLVIPEAMQAGLPVISTDCPVGPRELIDHGVDGLLVTPGDVAAIAAAITDLIESPARRRAMAASALKKADRFSAERIAARHEELYSTLVRGKPRTGRARRAAGRPPLGVRAPSLTCTSKSATELEILIEGLAGEEGPSLTHSRSRRSLRLASSGTDGNAERFRVAIEDLPPPATGTWSFTIGGREPRLRIIDNRRLVAELEARAGCLGALLPIESGGAFKINAIAKLRRAQLTEVSWEGEILILSGVLLGEVWPLLQLQIGTTAPGARPFAACRTGRGGEFHCRVDMRAALACLGSGDGAWKVWLVDEAHPSQRVRIGRVVSDLRDPGAVLRSPGATLSGATGDTVHIRPGFTRTGLLTLQVDRRSPEAISTDAVPIAAEADSARSGKVKGARQEPGLDHVVD